jgi:hypothetical protein
MPTVSERLRGSLFKRSCGLLDQSCFAGILQFQDERIALDPGGSAAGAINGGAGAGSESEHVPEA